MKPESLTLPMYIGIGVGAGAIAAITSQIFARSRGSRRDDGDAYMSISTRYCRFARGGIVCSLASAIAVSRLACGAT